MKEAKHFTLCELIPPDVLNQYGRDGWKLFDAKLIDTIDYIREQLGKPITINDWAWGGQFKLRGYRPINCKTGAVNSAHKQGMAVDFDVKGMTAQQTRDWLVANADSLPHKIRIEDGVNWVHLDTRNNSANKIVIFKP